MTHPTLEQIRSKFEDARQCTCCSTDTSGDDEREIAEATEAMFVLIEAGLAEADQLRARIAALEAEVERLKSPVGLVWRAEDKRILSQNVLTCFYEVGQKLNGSWYADFATPHTYIRVGETAYKDADQAKAACEAHHLARYREIQGVV